MNHAVKKLQEFNKKKKNCCKNSENLPDNIDPKIPPVYRIYYGRTWVYALHRLVNVM